MDAEERRGILSRLELVMGEYPGESRRVSADIQIVEEVMEDDVIRRRITFAVEPDDRCHAWLMIPRAPCSPRPALVCLHQTTEIGKDEPVGLGGKDSLHYARELTERGYVTLSPDYPNCGEYSVDCYAMGYASATMKGIWNHMRGVDLLEDMPEVDGSRIGSIGHSLGGHNTLFLAAFDERIQVAVSSCGFTLLTCSDDEGRGEAGDVKDWSHAGYMPRIADRYECRAENLPFDFPDILKLIAPRPIFINAPMFDSMYSEGVRECVRIVAPEYDKVDRAEDLTCAHPDCGHEFPADVREGAYEFIDRVLNEKADVA